MVNVIKGKYTNQHALFYIISIISTFFRRFILNREAMTYSLLWLSYKHAMINNVAYISICKRLCLNFDTIN